MLLLGDQTWLCDRKEHFQRFSEKTDKKLVWKTSPHTAVTARTHYGTTLQSSCTTWPAQYEWLKDRRNKHTANLIFGEKSYLSGSSSKIKDPHCVFTVGLEMICTTTFNAINTFQTCPTALLALLEHSNWGFFGNIVSNVVASHIYFHFCGMLQPSTQTCIVQHCPGLLERITHVYMSFTYHQNWFKDKCSNLPVKRTLK